MRALMTHAYPLSLRSCALLTALASVGCGADFDPQYKIQSLRVLGVQKDKSYPNPGDQVNLSLLWFDGSDAAPRPVQVAWFSGCFNPPGDLYYGCYEALGKGLAAIGQGQPPPPGFTTGVGERFSYRVPSDIISSHPPSKDKDAIPYGMSIVFFAVCAGELRPAPKDQQFPLGCFDGDRQLGSDGFVAGYTSTYVYEDLSNANPVITGFEFDNKVVFPDCIGDACVDDPAPPSDACGEGLACVDACPADGDKDDCPGIQIRPLISSSVAEKDSVAAASEGRDVTEQMWINYYVQAGGLKSEVRLLNDANQGFNSDYGTEFFAPKASGDIKLWAVAHDNRGGTEWTRVTVRVR